MRWKLPWSRPEPQQHAAEIVERLEAIEADDARVDKLQRRADRIMRENNLAPMIMRALGVRPR